MGVYSGGYNIEIKNNYVRNSNISVSKTAGDYGSLGGIVGIDTNSQILTIESCDVVNTNIEGKGIVGGVLGISQNKEQIKIKECNVYSDNPNIPSTIKSPKATSGIIGLHRSTNVDIDTIEISNLKIINNSNNTLYYSPYNVGGVIAISESPVTINNVKANNIEFDNEEPSSYVNIGGIIALSSYTTNIKNIEINYMTLNNFYNAGSILGILNADAKISKINAKNINIAASGNRGGLIAVANYSADVILNENEGDKATIDGIIISDNETGINSMGNMVGGAFGCIHLGTVNNIEIKNAQIQTNGPSVRLGGAFGLVCQTSVKNINVSNAQIISNSENDGKGYMPQAVGGIVGLLGYSAIIENSNIQGSDVQGEETRIESQYGNVGGIVGIASGDVKQCTADNISVEAIGSDNGTVGGLIGRVTNSSQETTDCSFTESTVETQYGYTGGIIGFGNGTIKSCTVSDSEVTSTSSSSYGVGGIAGAATPYIIGCTVEENSIIDGTSKVGGIIGNGGELTSEKYKAISILSCSVKNTTIKGTENVKKDIGYNSYYPEGYTGTKSQDEIMDFEDENNQIVNK